MLLTHCRCSRVRALLEHLVCQHEEPRRDRESQGSGRLEVNGQIVFRWLLDRHVATAARRCRSLRTKRVTPHVLRHTNAMLLRARDIDLLTIALWLGHETTTSTEIYLHADNKLKQRAIERTAPTGTPPGRYKPPDSLLAFLDGL